MLDFDLKSAVIDPVKIREYCLSPEHPRGKHKARVFQSALGLSQGDCRFLMDAIHTNLVTAEWVADEEDDYGRRYHVDMRIEFSGRSAVIRTLWIVRSGEKFPRLTSCFVHP
jgi:hypothetical protein